MTNAHRSCLLLALAIGLFASSPAGAQVIQIFKNQNKLPPGKPVIGAGAPSSTSATTGSGKAATGKAKKATGPLIESVSQMGDSDIDPGDSGRMDGGTSLHFLRRGAVLLVPASVEGKPVYFVFDTGATFTTLSSSFARSVGILPGGKSPTAKLDTAGGLSVARLGIIPRMRLGNRRHFNVTFAVCDGGACSGHSIKGRPVVGLLGLNLLRRYRTSIDDATATIQLVPGDDYANRKYDVEPWLKLGLSSVYAGGGNDVRMRLYVKLFNHARLTMRKVRVRVDCGQSGGTRHTFNFPPTRVPAHGHRTIHQDANMKTCADPQVDLRWARW